MSDPNVFFEAYQQLTSHGPEWVQGVLSGRSLTELFLENGSKILIFALLGWAIPARLEHKHRQYMDEREKLLGDIQINTSKHIRPDAVDATILYGSVVISHDLFRTFFIQFRKLIGGNIKAYERLIDRGRREAFIRLREEARLRGFNKVINVRFTNSYVTKSAIELVAYGTGITTRSTETKVNS